MGRGQLAIPIMAAANDAQVAKPSSTPYPPTTATTYSDTGATIMASRSFVSPRYENDSILLRFDTSVIPDNLTINSAKLRLYADSVSNADALSLTAGWGPLNMSTADYSDAPGTDANAGVPLSGLTAGTYVDIPLTDAAGFPEINKTGNTDVRLDISQRAADAAPTVINRFQTRSLNDPAFLPPMLIVQVSGLSVRNLVNPVKHVIGAGSLTSEGQEGYDSTRKLMRFHDGARERISSEAGYMPYAYPIGGGPLQAPTVSSAVAANGGVMAIPIVLEGHMLLHSVTYRDTVSSLARGPVEFGIYQESLGNYQVLDLVTGAFGTLAGYTPSVASNRTINVTSPPAYLAPGCYWLVIKNNHASNALALGNQAGGTMARNTAQTKTLTTTALGSTLDLVLATWTKITALPGVRLDGRVFGQATAF